MSENASTSTGDQGGRSILELSNDCFRLGVAPGLGGSIVHLAWTPPAAPGAVVETVDLMRRGTADDVAAGMASKLASFVMVPFANRIDGGRIPVAGGADQDGCVRVPVNRPEQRAAIHGFGRLAKWKVGEARADSLTLMQTFLEAGNPYAYEAVQTFAVSETQVVCRLRVTNRGSSALPFGIGFHPWFDRTPAATLELEAAHVFRMDERDMPLEAIGLGAVFGDGDATGPHRMRIAAQTPFDTPVAGWSGRATISWPERRVALDLAGEGALTLAHIFSPKQPEVFCVEPVSHMPDVVNRRELAVYGDMTLLAPGTSLEGAMRLTPRRLP